MEGNCKRRAQQLQRKYPHILNPLSYGYLTAAEVKPVYSSDQRSWRYLQDKLEYIDKSQKPDEDLNRFFKRQNINSSPKSKVLKTIDELFPEEEKKEQLFPRAPTDTPHFRALE